MSKKKEEILPKSKLKSGKVVKIALLVVAGIVTFLLFVSYSELRPWFVSEGLVNRVDVALGSLPLIPKTNNQVLKTAFYKNSKLTSARENVDLVLSQNGQTALHLNFEGAFDKSQEKTYQARLVGTAGPKEGIKLINLESLEKESKLFFKVDFFQPLFGLDLARIYGRWYALDVDDLASSLQAEVKSDEELRKEVKRFLQEGLKSSELRFRSLKREVVRKDGQNYLQFSTDLRPETVDEFFSAKIEAKNSHLVLVVEEKSGFLVSASFRSEIPVKVLNDLGVNPFFKDPKQRVQLSFQMDLDKINQKPDFVEPEKVVSRASSLEILQDILGGKAGSDSNNFYNLVGQNVEFGSNIIALERLQQVLFLAPVSF
ncbi:MAG: hypothetical protein Q8P13_04655 [bacterium]|nr:hypothetical protein [bacterium]